MANILLGLILAVCAPEPAVHHLRVLPDAAVFLDGLPARAADIPAGAEIWAHTVDLELFGCVLLRGPADRILATSPKRERP